MPEQETDELKERLQAFARELASAEDRLVGGLDDDEHQRLYRTASRPS